MAYQAVQRVEDVDLVNLGSRIVRVRDCLGKFLFLCPFAMDRDYAISY